MQAIVNLAGSHSISVGTASTRDFMKWANDETLAIIIIELNMFP